MTKASEAAERVRAYLEAQEERKIRDGAPRLGDLRALLEEREETIAQAGRLIEALVARTALTERDRQEYGL